MTVQMRLAMFSVVFSFGMPQAVNPARIASYTSRAVSQSFVMRALMAHAPSRSNFIDA